MSSSSQLHPTPLKWRQILVVLLAALSVSSVLGQGEIVEDGSVSQQQQQDTSVSTSRSQASRIYCGDKLVYMINIVCAIYGGTYSPTSQKRTIVDRSSWRSWLMQRERRGITHECCDRPCNYETMRRYCTVPVAHNNRITSNEAMAAADSSSNQEVTSRATRRPTTTTTTTTTTTAAPTTLPASPYGGIYSRTTSAHGRIPVINEQYFPTYYRALRDFNLYPY